ncbi:MAG: FAD-linked oxidase C-terminal domain-containing protein [Gemmatimonadales bacterium]
MKPATRTALDAFRPSSRASALPGALKSDLSRLLGPDGFIHESDRLLAYESDALTRIRGIPLAVALPGTREELQLAVRMLYEAEIPFVPRGAGTGLTGGAVARGAVIIGTGRLDRFLRLDPDERLAVVEPGVITDEISRRAAPLGLRYLPDPGSAPACTIGGNVATNAGGPHCLKHGVTSDHVLGLEVILPDGERLALDRGKSGGVDLGGLFVGSEGTFGIATAITVRLAPRPEAVFTSLALFDRIGAAGQAVTEILSAGIVPVALEIIDGTTIRTVERSPFAIGLPTDVGAALVVECEGTPEEAEEEMSAALTAIRISAPREIMSAASETERERLWRARKSAFGALGQLGPDILIEDTVVPRTVLPELLPKIEALAESHGLRLANFFHAGDGNLHPNIVFDVGDPEELGRVEAVRSEILDLCIDAGGTITGEHGIGLDKLKSVPRVLSAVELRTLRSVRDAFDPHGLCNPDKVLPREVREAARSVGIRELGSAAESVEIGRKAGTSVWQAPASQTELQEVLAARAAGSAVLATGAEVLVERAPPIPEHAIVVSTAALRGSLDHRRDDLTVTVGAGRRMGEVVAELSREGQWIPLAGPSLALTVGGLVAAAPPGPFDGTFGPLRRQLLEIHAMSLSGDAQRWGRPVMKNVAGYDFTRLYCGSFGQLGVITEATFRLWPRPAAFSRLVARGPTLHFARALAGGEAEGTVPDGARWTRESSSDGTVEEKVVIWLLGSERSTESRREKLDRLARRFGITLRHDPEGEGEEPVARRRLAVGARRGDLRVTAPAADCWEMPERLASLLGEGWSRIDLLPGAGVLNVAYDRDPDAASPLVERILDACAGADVAVERGGPEEHRLARRRRPASIAALEGRVIAAAGGQDRCWQADYV